MARPGTLSALHGWLRRELADAGLADAATDARVLILGLFDLSAAELLTRGDRAVSEAEFATAAAALERRRKREPVHRILGARDFYGLTLRLSPETLEPRPDTEILVERILPHAQRIADEKGCVRILDLGTGTGAIVLALLNECPAAVGVGADLAPGALRTARENAEAAGLAARFDAVESDWFSAIEGRFDIIVSNPPYIRTDVVAALEAEVRDYDPGLALDGGRDGLVAYRRIAADALAHLETGGVIGVEIGYDQRQDVEALFELKGFQTLETARDYGGNDRVVVFAAKAC
ncbi:peptide chain release factor N(5)-glutamine methyltransferase [Rhizobiaceae bacterium BDR2-2]|uniref:Release factor glutamine methyltransferase n=1 Tax=Ectorhizobium quercum TaxID=2965071 RepID=A0AAE3SYB3_9HYPH|nr:peptide chain release factor N(5)-glutamine methyltransferase [Ectorhizobium quercum]MCX8999984.1 peptide chain release factor N(5)-glutamine methyltransferase [Ectorhizobium quercum]